MKCGLCGHEFTEQEGGCNPACPFVGGCSLVCCPRCGYHAPDESRSTIVRLARKVREIAGRRRAPREVDVDG